MAEADNPQGTPPVTQPPSTASTTPVSTTPSTALPLSPSNQFFLSQILGQLVPPWSVMQGALNFMGPKFGQRYGGLIQPAYNWAFGQGSTLGQGATPTPPATTPPATTPTTPPATTPQVNPNLLTSLLGQFAQGKGNLSSRVAAIRQQTRNRLTR
jgi:hypothetical protein